MEVLANQTTAVLEFWCLIFCIYCFLSLRKLAVVETDKIRYQKLIVISNMMVLIFDIIGVAINGMKGEYVAFGIIASNTILYCFSYVFVYCFAKYIGEDFPEKDKNLIELVALLDMVAGIAITLANLVFKNLFYVNSENVYFRGNWFWLSQALGLLPMLFFLIMTLLRYSEMNREQAKTIFLFLGITGAATIAQLMGTPFTLLNAAMSMGVMMIIINSMLLISQQLVDQEKRVSEMNSNIVKSQIRPHFLYNCLNSIYYLCDDDPIKAKAAISDFSEYLRTDLDSLNGDRLIPFEKELEHVNTYIRLEKMRFEDELKIEYDLNCTDFMIPSLTLQPIVENAVKHGISKKKNGGTIVISTDVIRNDAVIRISDDGVGFDPLEPISDETKRKDGRSHIGVLNVKKRVFDICRGQLEIESARGRGTTVIIKIPLEEQA